MTAEPITITCPWCGATSTHPTDIAERYCGRCHRWHDPLPEIELDDAEHDAEE